MCQCRICCLGDDENADVTVAYDSDDVNEVAQEDGKRSKSGRQRRRRASRPNSLASYRSVDSGSCQSDPSIRCVSVRSATQRCETCCSYSPICRRRNTTEKFLEIDLTATCLDQRSCSTLSPVSSGMGDCLQAGKLSHYVTSHLGQLSLPSLRG